MRFHLKPVTAASALALALGLMAAPSSALAADKDEEKAAPVTDYEPIVSQRQLSGTFGGKRVDYTARVAETVLKDDDGKPKAAIVTTSYVAKGNDRSRPVTFLFNGGPGSASLWLQLGAFGPKRVETPGDATDDGAPPYPIVDNPDSILDVTDLVFIDPVGTGFSHAIGDTEAKEYYGMSQDAKSVAEVIRKWLTENGRWNSPKYLGGESYGTTRSALVASELESGWNDVALNGVILISAILDFPTVWGGGEDGNEIVYPMYVPSMAVAAAYHGKREGGSPARIAEEARQFALGPYMTALLKGQDLPADEHARIRAELSRITGLSEDFLERANLRVTPDRFYKELLRDRGLVVGRFDARYTGKDYDNAGAVPDNDPSGYGIDGAYVTAANDWLRRSLGFDTERDYVPLGGVTEWDWRPDGEGSVAPYLNVAPRLSRAMRENSDLRVFVGQGWYDFATPFFGAEYSMNRPGFPKERMTWKYYDAGHMMYLRNEDRTKLSQDVRAFITAR